MLTAAATDNLIPMDPAYIRRVAYLNQDPDLSVLLATGFVEIVDESADQTEEANKRKLAGKKIQPSENNGVNTLMPIGSRVKGRSALQADASALQADASNLLVREEKRREERTTSKPETGFDHALQDLFDYYLKAVSKNPKLYDFTTFRKKKGMARLRFCHQKASEPKLENAIHLFKLAIDRFAASPFHNGKNEHGKKYLDWELLCRSDEKFAYWLDDQNHGVGLSA